MPDGGAGLVEIAVAALVVGLDNFAVALALASLGAARRAWRITLAFVTFGAAAPALGALLGQELSAFLTAWADVIAALLLAGVGLLSLRSGMRVGDLESTARRLSAGPGLLVLAGSVSADNLAVGFGLGLHGAQVLPLALACGTSVGVLTVVGLRLGSVARERWERWSLFTAGLLLLALAVAIVLGWP